MVGGIKFAEGGDNLLRAGAKRVQALLKVISFQAYGDGANALCYRVL